MNPIKIEKAAIDELRKIVRLHDKMDEFLQNDDKTPCWDGEIWIYKNSNLKSGDILYRISTQVKGRNDEKLLKRKSISYPVEYKSLRNYRNDGGVCYFVAVVSNDGAKVSIYYNALTPIKLESLLKGTEKKNAEQTKNIVLIRLKNNDKEELYKILLQFGHDSKEQATGELIRKAISIQDIEKVDSVRMTTFVSDTDDVMEKIKTAEACLFGHLADADIWLPMSYDLQRSIEWESFEVINKSFGVDRVTYYNNFEFGKNSNGDFIIRLSKNLYINMKTNKLTFTPKTDVETLIMDTRFIEAMKRGKTLCVDARDFCEYENANLNEEIEKAIVDFSQIYRASIKFQIKLTKAVENFTSDDWKSIHELVNLYQKKIKPKTEMTWYIWWCQGKLVPFFLAKDDNGQILVENGINMKHLQIMIGQKDNGYRVPAFVMFKRDIWEKLIDIDESFLLEEIEKSEFNYITEGNYSLLLVEVLAAYDTTENEKYYDIATLISDKLLQVEPLNEYWRLNKLQLLKRKRELSEEEMQDLEEIEQSTNDTKVRCAANILLDNRRIARKELDDMSEEDRSEFINFPICNMI